MVDTDKTSTPPLFRLPNELLILIFQQLQSPFALASLAQTTRRARAIALAVGDGGRWLRHSHEMQWRFTEYGWWQWSARGRGKKFARQHFGTSVAKWRGLRPMLQKFDVFPSAMTDPLLAGLGLDPAAAPYIIHTMPYLEDMLKFDGSLDWLQPWEPQMVKAAKERLQKATNCNHNRFKTGDGPDVYDSLPLPEWGPIDVPREDIRRMQRQARRLGLELPRAFVEFFENPQRWRGIPGKTFGDGWSLATQPIRCPSFMDSGACGYLWKFLKPRSQAVKPAHGWLYVDKEGTSAVLFSREEATIFPDLDLGIMSNLDSDEGHLTRGIPNYQGPYFCENLSKYFDPDAIAVVSHYFEMAESLVKKWCIAEEGELVAATAEGVQLVTYWPTFFQFEYVAPSFEHFLAMEYFNDQAYDYVGAWDMPGGRVYQRQPIKAPQALQNWAARRFVSTSNLGKFSEKV